MVKISYPTVLGIPETKLDNSIGDSESYIGRCCAIWCDRNRKVGGVFCYVTKKICYKTKNCISNEVENIFIELLFQKQNQLLLELFINLQTKQGF